ncbi:MAG: hypothetical protein QOE63_1819, partial [Acidimicrobiaceae bacterium]
PTICDVNHTNRSKWSARALAIIGCAALLAAAIAPSAQAAPASPNTTTAKGAVSSGPYGGNANGDLLDVTLAQSPLGSALGSVPTLALLHLTHADATAASAGPVNGDAALRTSAFAANVDPLVVLGAIDLTDVLSSIAQVAPPDNGAPATKNLLAIPANPVVTASVSDASALAHWAGDGKCVAADEPLAEGINRTAQADVLPGLPAPISGSLLSVNAAQQGASFVQSTLSLPSIAPIAGKTDPRAVESDQTTHTAGLSVLGVSIDVGAVDPVLTAVATGYPGGAAVHYTAPIVKINGNQVIGQTDVSALIAAAQPLLAPLLTGLAPLLKITLDVPTEAQVEASGTVAGDGTSAAVDTHIVRLTATLAPGVLDLLVADVALGPMHAEAFAPAGGIDCGGPNNPITVTKNANKTTVQPGETFIYTITMANTSADCTLTNVHLTDTLTGPDGSTITATDPQASSSTWPKVTWSSLPNIPPGGHIDLHITVQVPNSATAGATYSDTAVGSGTCNATDYDTPFTLSGIPTVVIGLLPRTGGDSTLPLLGGMMLLLGAVAMRRLRRS